MHIYVVLSQVGDVCKLNYLFTAETVIVLQQTPVSRALATHSYTSETLKWPMRNENVPLERVYTVHSPSPWQRLVARSKRRASFYYLSNKMGVS